MKLQSATMVGLGVSFCALSASAQSVSAASSANELQASTAARQDGWRSNAEHYGAAAAWFGLAALSSVEGAWFLISPSPVESALHDYERSSGHIVTDGSGASAPKFRLGAAPSGFIGGAIVHLLIGSFG